MSAEHRLEHPVVARFTEDEHRLIAEVAEKTGRPKSAVLREITLEALDRAGIGPASPRRVRVLTALTGGVAGYEVRSAW